MYNKAVSFSSVTLTVNSHSMLLTATPEVAVVGRKANTASRGAEDEEGGFGDTNNRDPEAEQRRKKRNEKVSN